LVVEQGLADSREKAQALILAGKILVGDHLYTKPGIKIESSLKLRVRGEVDHYVSRGAHKLLGALDHFGIKLEGALCLDIGASTGGFTQVCLERGAAKVYAVDVGHNQLDWKIRSDKRVVNFEKVNFREAHITHGTLIPKNMDFICIDTSFISLKLILPAAKEFLKKGGVLVALIKPQHEVGKENVGKGGIVQDQAIREAARDGISSFAQSIGFTQKGLIESPIKGTTGNTEYLIHLVLN